MTTQIQDNFRVRRNFGKQLPVIDLPNLIEIQKASYDQFLQFDEAVRRNVGLQSVFKSVFPIKDFNDTCELQFLDYTLDPPKYDVEECRQRGMTYASSVRVKVRLIHKAVDEDSGKKRTTGLIEQEVYFGEIPLMTENGTFIVNGTERVVVSQLHRSPGVFFEHDKGRTHSSGKFLYSARIIPYRGSWLDFEFDAKDIIYVRIDRRRKLPATVLLRALGHSTAELLNYFYDTETIHIERPTDDTFDYVIWLDGIAHADIRVDGELVVEKGEVLLAKLTMEHIEKMIKAGVSPVPVSPELIAGTRLAETATNLDGEGIPFPGKKKKLLVEGTVLSAELMGQLLEYNHTELYASGTMPCDFVKTVNLELLLGQRATRDIYLPDGSLLLKSGAKFGAKLRSRAIRKLQESGLEKIPVSRESVIGKIAAEDIYDPVDGDVVIQINEEITHEVLEELEARNIRTFHVLFIDDVNVGSFLRDTLMQDKINSPEEAQMEIYRRLRPGEPPTVNSAADLFTNLFYEQERYDLSAVGRLKFIHKFDQNIPVDKTTLTPQDILQTVEYLINLKNGRSGYEIDDIDHLGNRRVRPVGELLENQYRIGLVRMERAIKERMVIQELDSLMPDDLLNSKPVSAVVKEFFGSSQLSQFMDQTNPLSETTHRRRLSALGPGGLTRDRAGFEVRDVHPTHYGRICPIETPEGPNIGLITSLASYARVNEYGFIETPYRTVVDGQGTSEVRYYSALEEQKYFICPANTELDKEHRIIHELVTVRKGGETFTTLKEEVQLMDVSTNQLVSVAASLIPFLEHDDANRALMGSNMQRQAVPLLKSRAPLVGTGIEKRVARDSGATVVAKRTGLVEQVDASRIMIRVVADNNSSNELGVEIDIYKLQKYRRSNQNTCVNQKPIVKQGDFVYVGEVIADGPSTECGELALGQNVLVAFMPWGGYNFEDSILLSERVVKEDVYTSVHIEEFECVARDTKLGKEEITSDIPNVGDEALRYLDESGIIVVGTEVKPGDILVGKITPKGETQLSPEEKLLRAIFGEKAGDVRDTSLRVPPGVVGTVIDGRVFSRRKGEERDYRTKQIEELEEANLRKDLGAELKILRKSKERRLLEVLVGQTTDNKLVHKGETLLPKGKILTEELLLEIPRVLWSSVPLIDMDVQLQVRDIENLFLEQEQIVMERYEEKIENVRKGDELPPGVLKMVKVYVAIKRKLQVGDKMAGRHGNKGVVSRILPEEDMPYLADGTPVDVVLNPLGVPSRMNIGQILETHLGWAAWGLGRHMRALAEQHFSVETGRRELKKIFSPLEESEHQGKMVNVHQLIDTLNEDELRRFCRKYREGVPFASPVFDGASEKEIHEKLKLTELPESGQTVLFDGKTGDAFSSDVTVGVMYVLKLHHLVDDKIHARSIGPYSLVTQQPLGGKAQFGGQRLGEMEVWAMEAYGAAHCLQEFLTVKSDDVNGRTRMYESIVKGDNVLESGLPESFNVLIKELQSLALDVELLEDIED